jgi:type 1 glutamine amidotransferase
VTRPEAIRVHVVVGGYPPGTGAAHDMDYARRRILELLAEHPAVAATISNDFRDIERWLDGTRLLVTYVAGPHPDAQQDAAIRSWLEAGGRWLGLHGTSGGRAARIGDSWARKMVKGPHHETLGCFFLNHPPVRRFRVDVSDRQHPLTRGLPESFEVADELYLLELQQPVDCRVLLTTQLDEDPSPQGFGFHYDEDTSPQGDGRTRALGFVKPLGAGEVAYVALGHCHSPSTNGQPFVDPSVNPDGKTPLLFRGPWEVSSFETLLRNGIAWGIRQRA